MAYLGDFEQLILLALLRLGPEAYGAELHREIEGRSGRKVSMGALYTTLSRMEKKGYVSSRIGEPTAERGGRRKKYFQLEAVGREALSRSYEAVRRMASGLESALGRMAADSAGGGDAS